MLVAHKLAGGRRIKLLLSELFM